MSRATQPTAVTQRTTAGFTLLEILVSMTILSLLATTVLFGWRIATSAWQKANTKLQRSRTVLETNRLLQEQMASMVWYQVHNQKGEQFLFFEGEPQTARFISRYSLQGRASSGLYRIEYHVEPSAGGSMQLLMTEYPVYSSDELAALIGEPQPGVASKTRPFVPFERGSQTMVLFDGLRECRFEYYKPELGDQPGKWSAEWTSDMTQLPQGMAIRITAGNGAGDLQPVPVVAAIRNVTSELPREDD